MLCLPVYITISEHIYIEKEAIYIICVCLWWNWPRRFVFLTKCPLDIPLCHLRDMSTAIYNNLRYKTLIVLLLREGSFPRYWFARPAKFHITNQKTVLITQTYQCTCSNKLVTTWRFPVPSMYGLGSSLEEGEEVLTSPSTLTPCFCKRAGEETNRD